MWRPSSLPFVASSQGAKKTVFFATAGEKGAVKLWSSDTGACVHEVAPEVQVGAGQAVERQAKSG